MNATGNCMINLKFPNNNQIFNFTYEFNAKTTFENMIEFIVELYPHEIVSYYLPKVSTATGRYIDIQNEVIKKYNIIMDENSSCRMRTHCHPKERRICKFHPQNSARSTFLLFHEIGHAETKKSSMRRCESEYYATKWAIEKAKEYGITIPDDVIKLYQDYIDRELARGLRRGGSNYNEDMDLYKLL